MAIQFLNNVNADSGALYVDAIDNRVGINTSSPQVPLEVKYSGTEDEIIRIVGTASGKPQMTFYNGGTLHTKIVAAGNNDFSITNTHSTGDMFFAAGGSTRLHIEANGNVGIGTTSPGAKLEVEQSNSSTNTVFLSNSFNNKGFRTGHSGFATFAGYQDSNNTTSGSAYGSLIGLNTFYDGTNFYNDNQYIDPSSVLFKDGNIIFHTNDISATGNFTPNERLRISKTGNVGIGTNSPTEKLEVAGAIKMSENSSYPLTIDHNSATTTNEITTVGGLNIISGSNNSINFKDATTTNMSISGYSGDVLMGYNTGKVGIGTTSPTDKLTVENGNIRLNSTSSYPSQGLVAHWNNNSPNMGAINWRNDPGFIGSEWIHNKQSSPYTQARVRMTGDANGNFNVNLNNSQVFTILASNGNVGIGVTNPGAKLDISNTGGNAT